MPLLCRINKRPRNVKGSANFISAFQVMKMFIEKGVVPTYTDILNQTVLYYVAREGKANCVEMLLKLGMK